MRRLLGLLAVAWLAVQPAGMAQAHVVITDQTHQLGGILHVSPDDDPVAGQSSNLFFDLQSSFSGQTPSAKLEITDDRFRQANVPAVVVGSTVSSDYTFPSQGVYLVRLTLTSGAQSYVFDYSQRVSRGTAGSPLDQPVYGWAQALLIFGAAGLAVVAIVVYNRWAAIRKQSTM